MRIFVAASYSSHVDYDTGEVYDDYRDWLEAELSSLEMAGHIVFCALRDDGYKLNDADPSVAFRLDTEHISSSDALLAYVGAVPSVGVQTEIGYALALGKKVFIAHADDVELAYFNKAIVLANHAIELTHPISDSIDLLV
jgi:nucleoside 2-deoxyribosyltransferase